MERPKFKISKKRLKQISNIQKEAEDSYGGGHLKMGNEVDKFRRIPTGAMQMDIITGGGYAIGGVFLFWGWQGCGKTTMCLKAAAEAQKICSQCHTYIGPVFLEEPEDEDKREKWRAKRMSCMNCGSPYHKSDRKPPKAKDLYGKDLPEGMSKNDQVCDECGEADTIEDLDEGSEYVRTDGGYMCDCGACDPCVVLFMDFEGRFNPEWAESLGVNLNALLLEQPEYGEAGIDVSNTAISEGVVDLVIVDSVAHIATTEELAKSTEESVVGTGARLVNKFLRGLPSRISQANNNHGVKVTTFIVNQVRKEIGNLFGSGDTMYGGHGQVFLASQILKFTSAKEETEETAVGASSRKEFVGSTQSMQIRVQCEKNSNAATTGLRTTFRLMTQDDEEGVLDKGDVDDFKLTYKYGRNTGVIQNEGDWTVKGWPLTYDNAGDLKMDMHHRPHFTRHIKERICYEIRENWREVRKHLKGTL